MLKRSEVIIKGVLLFILVLSWFAGCSKETIADKAGEEQRIAMQNSVEEEKWGNAPDFTLPKLGGGQFRLSSLKGKVIILDFWATWCPPCRKGIPDFVELYSKYKDKGLEIVGVCLESKATVKPFAEKMGINYTLVFADREISYKYGGIRYIPTTFIIDQQGNIAEKHIGYVSKETFEEEIKELLSK